MAKCFFNKDLKQGYSCEYTITEGKMSIDVEYNNENEVPYENGIKVNSFMRNFDKRDILVVDSSEKKFYLLKEAVYSGMSSRFGTLDNVSLTKFNSYEYFEANSYNELLELPCTPKVNAIKIYSSAILDYYKHPSVTLAPSDDELKIVMSKRTEEKYVDIYLNNVENIFLGDDWSYNYNGTLITIEMDAYLGIKLTESVSYTEIYKYIYEAMVFMQLYYPGKFKIDRIMLDIEGKTYLFATKSLRPARYTDKTINFSVKVELLDFLKRCYTNIPYRDTEGTVRIIPYVIMNSYRSFEDNFLMLFRFVECFYKTSHPNYRQKKLIENSITDHYRNGSFDNNTRKREAKEIVELRNHYVHSGYYIHDSLLPIRFDRDKPTQRDYIVEADVEWLYAKIKLLYEIVIDIIFTEMLGYEEYDYRKVF